MWLEQSRSLQVNIIILSLNLVQDTINKIKQGVYLPKERPESKFTDNSQNSFPVRLEETNESESSIDLKANSDIDTPEEVEQLYQSLLRNVKTNSGFPKVTTVSQNSKNTNPQDSKKETQKDWITTQLYEDYEQYGKHEFNHAYDSMFYTESEIYNVYEFVKSRYNTKEYDKSVAPFYKKAMATLGELMFSMSLVSIFRSIEEMYNKISVTNTLKLLIRCRLLFDARRQVLEIFERIRMFKLLKTKVKNLISFQLDFGADATATHDKLKRYEINNLRLLFIRLKFRTNSYWREVEEWMKAMLEEIISLLKDHRQLGKKSFIFDKKEWLSHWVKEYVRFYISYTSKIMT